MKVITRIESARSVENKKLRVAAYSRVSTSSDAQLESLDAQVKRYDSFTKEHDDWEYAGLYFDEGITGTKKEGRAGLLRMLDDCRQGRIDFILTKSISRFSRNKIDCLTMVRGLLGFSIGIFFEKENINTMDSSGELLLTIMSSIAQQESVSLYKNVRIGVQYRFQQGQVYVNYNRFLGYTRDAEGNLVIVPEEAEVVKRIFREYLAGGTTTSIAAGLERDGILNGEETPYYYSGDGVLEAYI